VQAGSDDDAGVRREGADALCGVAAIELDSEQDVRPLGLRVRGHGVIPAAGAAGGMAADAPTLARWGYQLYGARLLPAETVHQMMTQESPGTVFPGVGAA
jgi:hypothetical protein